MSALAQLRKRGLKLTASDDKLLVEPKSVLDDELRAFMRENKAALIQELTGEDPVIERRRQRVLSSLAQLPATARYAFDVSYDGENAVIAVAVRHVATCEFRVPRTKFDPFLFLQFVQQQAAQ